jgi:hypothetical protein
VEGRDHGNYVWSLSGTAYMLGILGGVIFIRIVNISAGE